MAVEGLLSGPWLLGLMVGVSFMPTWGETDPQPAPGVRWVACPSNGLFGNMRYKGPGPTGVGTEGGRRERARSVGPATASYVQGPINALNLDFLKSSVPHVWAPCCPPRPRKACTAGLV